MLKRRRKYVEECSANGEEIVLKSHKFPIWNVTIIITELHVCLRIYALAYVSSSICLRYNPVAFPRCSVCPEAWDKERNSNGFHNFYQPLKKTWWRSEKRHQLNKKKHEDGKVLDEDNLEKLLKLLLTFVAIK